MKKLSLLCAIGIYVFAVASCEAPPTNTAGNANTNSARSNANAVKPAGAAPSVEALFDKDKKANEAWIKNDIAFFEGMLSDNFVSFNNGQRSDKTAELAMLKALKCDVKSWSLEDPQMSKINDDTYVVSYRGNFDGTCTWEGKTEKVPSPVRAASIWVRDGENWKGVYHSETPIIDPKNPPQAAPPKKEETGTSQSGAPKPAAGANTDTLVKMHQAGWEAFKAKDAKWFNEHISSNFALVDPLGNWVPSKAEAIRSWTETMNCEGITNVKVSDGVASAISPTVEILTLKGTADGTCNGQKNGDLWQTAVYVKEGDTWKLAFMFESPAV